jgi:hypothetical protein
MPGAPIQVGPFVGGLNTFSDPTAIADNELTVCENFELDLDGSLKSRPPIQNLGINFPLDSSGNVQFLGNYYTNTGQSYLIASDGNSSTYYFNGTTWLLITDTFSAAAFAQFDDKGWLPAAEGSGDTGGYWDPGTGFTADGDMPAGECIVVFKDRMWIAEGRNSGSQGTRLYRSKTLADPALWVTSNDFVDIGSGDGQNIVQLAVYFNTLLIFRTDSIYGLQYTSDPAAAVVSLVVPNVGLSSKDSLTQFETYIYFMYDEKAYEFVNNRASQINVKVPFFATSTSNTIYLPYAVSEFNQRIIFTYFDQMFVYNLRTRSWTIWKSSVYGSLSKMFIRLNNQDKAIVLTHKNVVVPTGGTRVAPLLQITDEYASVEETMQCKIQTKNFNYQASSIYKRLFWWGLDARFKGTVVGTAVPITQTFTVPWQTLFDNETWGSMLNYVWGSPQEGSPAVSTSVTEFAVTFRRIFTKFLKSLRFRQIYFEVTFTTNGSSGEAPVRLFSLMTYVNPKQTVGKEIT